MTNDTADNLAGRCWRARDCFRSRHGLLARDRRTGQPVFGFIHGNWALDNSRPDGRWCGVNNELDVLRETGCYADFTFPSAPSPTQPRKINSIYYAVDDPERPRSHDRGIDVGTGPAPAQGLMLIQGPLVLDWRRPAVGHCCRGSRTAAFRSASRPISIAWPSGSRRGFRCPPARTGSSSSSTPMAPMNTSHDVLLGEPMVRFHRALADRAESDANFHYHYVTARDVQPGQGRGGRLGRLGRRRPRLPPDLGRVDALRPLTE